MTIKNQDNLTFQVIINNTLCEAAWYQAGQCLFIDDYQSGHNLGCHELDNLKTVQKEWYEWLFFIYPTAQLIYPTIMPFENEIDDETYAIQTNTSCMISSMSSEFPSLDWVFNYYAPQDRIVSHSECGITIQEFGNGYYNETVENTSRDPNPFDWIANNFPFLNIIYPAVVWRLNEYDDTGKPIGVL